MFLAMKQNYTDSSGMPDMFVMNLKSDMIFRTPMLMGTIPKGVDNGSDH